MILTTERLRLRGAEPADAEPLFAVYGDAETMRYWSSGQDATPDDTRARLAGKLARPAPGIYLVIERDGTAIGALGHSGGGEIGYLLHRAHWGQGLAREALSAFIPYLFDSLDLPALRAEVDPANIASVVVLSKLGFRVTGYSRDYYLLEGQPCDSVYMRLPRPGGLSS